MKISTNTRPEMDTHHQEEGSSFIDYFDRITNEVDDLTDRMQRIYAVSVMASFGLEEALARGPYAKETLAGVFRAIECLADVRNAQI